jgi:opacity protein-like surface antigen
MLNQLFARSSVFLFALTLLFSASLHAQEDDLRWYGSLSVGQLINTEFDSSSVTISTSPFRIESVGNFDITGHWNWAASVGREFGSASNIRLEGEFWGGAVKREGFVASALSTTLDDDIRARALLVNGLLRVVNNNRLKVWIGAGIGVADVRMQKAAGSTCNCLSEADGEGETYRIKMSFENELDNGDSWFVEVGNVWLPDTETDTSLSSFTRHGKLTSAELRIGYRLAF